MCGYLNMNDKRGENRALGLLELGVGYSSEGKGFPNTSVTALKGKGSWGPRNTTKSCHTYQTSCRRFIEKDARGCLRLLRQQGTEQEVDFCRLSLGRSSPRWRCPE